MSDVFISYSRKDKEFAETLHTALEKSGKDAWIDWQDIPLTSEWWKEIETGIEGADTFIFVISPDSVASKVCGEEIDHAVKHNKRLFPVVRRDMAQFDPKPKDLQKIYIENSRKVEDANNQAVLILKEAKETTEKQIQEVNLQVKKAEIKVEMAEVRKKQIVRQGLIFLGTFLGVIVVGAGTALSFAGFNTVEAQNNLENSEIQTFATEAKADWIENSQTLDNLLLALKTGDHLQNRLKQNTKVPSVVQWQTKIALQQAEQTIEEKNRLNGHQTTVNSVSFSPDGKTLASASDDNTVKLWDVGTGKELKTLNGHQAFVESVSFSPDGKTLASASMDNTVKLWDVSTGKELKTLNGHQAFVKSVSFAPDGKTLASASADNTVKLWDVVTGKELKTLNGHQDTVTSVCFSPDGKTLASASMDNTVKLWDVVTGKALKTLKGHQDFVSSVSYSPDGKTLASASYDKTVKLWDVVTGKELKTLYGHQDFVFSVSFSPDGKTLASASADNTVILWNFHLNKGTGQKKSSHKRVN